MELFGKWILKMSIFYFYWNIQLYYQTGKHFFLLRRNSSIIMPCKKRLLLNQSELIEFDRPFMCWRSQTRYSCRELVVLIVWNV
jgi:hypothetical protein